MIKRRLSQLPPSILMTWQRMQGNEAGNSTKNKRGKKPTAEEIDMITTRKHKNIMVSLTIEAVQKLDEYAESTGLKKSYVLNKALEEYLAKRQGDGNAPTTRS